MIKVFEKILNRLEIVSYRIDDSASLCTRDVIDIEDAINAVQEVAQEYSYLSEEFNSGLLKRIADYFSTMYEGDDKTAPKMELSVNELRYIANLHVENCRLQKQIRENITGCWISVDDNLPKKEGSYLVIGKTGGATVARWYEPNEIHPLGHWGGNSADYIKYWMPRPQAPNQK